MSGSIDSIINRSFPLNSPDARGEWQREDAGGRCRSTDHSRLRGSLPFAVASLCQRTLSRVTLCTQSQAYVWLEAVWLTSSESIHDGSCFPSMISLANCKSAHWQCFLSTATIASTSQRIDLLPSMPAICLLPLALSQN